MQMYIKCLNHINSFSCKLGHESHDYQLVLKTLHQILSHDAIILENS